MFSSSRKSSKNHQLRTLQGLSERANEAQTDTIQRSIRQSTTATRAPERSLLTPKQQEQSLQGGKPTTKYHLITPLAPSTQSATSSKQRKRCIGSRGKTTIECVAVTRHGTCLSRPLLETWIWVGNGRETVVNLNLQLWCGGRLALKGPSGSGKTQLLRAISRLDPLSNGQLRLAGKWASRWHPPAWRAAVLYVGQQTPVVEGSVETNLLWPLRFHLHRRRRAHLPSLPDWLQQLDAMQRF